MKDAIRRISLFTYFNYCAARPLCVANKMPCIKISDHRGHQGNATKGNDKLGNERPPLVESKAYDCCPEDDEEGVFHTMSPNEKS